MDTAVLISCMALTGTLLIVLLLLCRLVQPHDIAWFLSNREDKLKLSKMRLYNANGYVMHSGSEILLGSTGSFQRFDSVDRDYKPQYGARSGIAFPPWRTSTEEPNIPPQPLRPAPSPRELQISREKPIMRQTSEPKAPSSRSILISPIPRPVPRKQHSAPISFPLPLLISPQSKTSHPAWRSQDQSRPMAVPHLPCTNPFLSGSPLNEEAGEGITGGQHVQETALLPPRPLTAPHSMPSNVSESNPFIVSPAAVTERYEQQQQQQQFSLFNFDLPSSEPVQAAHNHPPRGGNALLSGSATEASSGVVEAAECSDSQDSLPAAPPAQEDDPLRRDHSRISKMENLRRMSRLIESNQVLLNIYQQFNRTISEQAELPPVPAMPSAHATPAEVHPPAASTSLAEGPVHPAQLMPSRTEAHLAHGGMSAPGKYRDSPRTDVAENIRMPTVSRSIKHILRNRSFSETEFSERKLIKTLAILSESDAPARAYPVPSASPAKLIKNASYKDLSQCQTARGLGGDGSRLGGGADKLHKTVSESFLEQYSPARYGELNGTCREFSLSGGGLHAPDAGGFPHAAEPFLPSSSCESVASESSVVYTDLVPIRSQPVAGYMKVGLQYGLTTDDGRELQVTVQEAKDLVPSAGTGTMDTFVKVLFTPDEDSARQTKVCKDTDHPTYGETFSFWQSNHSAVRRSLWFYVYLSSANSETLIGEAQLEMEQNMQLPMASWLKLSDSSYRNVGLGELMLSLSYLPTAERLTVVVVKARNLALKPRVAGTAILSGTSVEPDPADKEVAHEPDGGGNVFVKVYLLQNDRKLSKKKTSVKRAEQFPIYNEAIIFSLPPYMLNAVQIRLSVVQMVQRVDATATADGLDRKPAAEGARKPSVKLVSLGHVIVGSGTTGKGLRHWHQMLTALRKPVTMWHGIKCTSERRRRKAAPSMTEGDAD